MKRKILLFLSLIIAFGAMAQKNVDKGRMLTIEQGKGFYYESIIIGDSDEMAKAEVPGPVHIGIPAGLGQVEIKQAPANSLKSIQLQKKSLDKGTITVFNDSKKPVLAIGLTSVRLGLKQIIIKIAEKFQIPVVLTPMAKGLFSENHQLYAGVLFHALSDLVAKTYSEADLVVGIGYDPIEFNYEDWMPEVPLIHFDTTPADVDKNKIIRVFNEVGDLPRL